MHDRKLFVWNGTNYHQLPIKCMIESYLYGMAPITLIMEWHQLIKWNGTNYHQLPPITFLKRRSPNIKILLLGKIFNHHLCNKYPTVSGVFLRLPDR